MHQEEGTKKHMWLRCVIVTRSFVCVWKWCFVRIRCCSCRSLSRPHCYVSAQFDTGTTLNLPVIILRADRIVAAETKLTAEFVHHTWRNSHKCIDLNFCWIKWRNLFYSVYMNTFGFLFFYRWGWSLIFFVSLMMMRGVWRRMKRDRYNKINDHMIKS